MLAKKITSVFSRFVKPRISQYENFFQLINDKRWVLRFVNQRNKQALEKTKDHPYYHFQENLKLNKRTIKNSMNHEIQLAAYSPIAHKKYNVRQNLATGQLKYDFLPEDIQNPFVDDPTNVKNHYSMKNREVPIIEEYKIDENIVMLFNLPEDITEQDILKNLLKLNIQSIKFGYCLLGLPSYAKITFKNKQEVEKFVSVYNEYIQIGQKFCYFYTQANQARLNIRNRMMVIKDLSADMSPSELFNQLCKYGRITYFDHPQTIEKGISLDQARQIFRTSANRVKLNYYRKDGTIESEYYPPYIEKDLMKPLQEIQKNNFNYNMMDQLLDQDEKNKKKLKFAQNINIYEKNVGAINIVPKQFAIFVFSCPDQAQNCYFAMKNTFKIDLVKDKYQFDFDKAFKQRLLRYIDNQFLTKKIQEKKDQVDQAKLFYMMSLPLIDRLKQEEYRQLNNNVQVDQNDETHYEWALYVSSMEKIIKSVGQKKEHGKSFDELAQMELFGRMLPKHQKKTALKLQNYEQGRKKPVYSFQNPSIQQIPKAKNIAFKDFKAANRKERIEKNFAQGLSTQVPLGNISPPLQADQIEQMGQLIDDVFEEGDKEGDRDLDQDQVRVFKGKRRFSTFKMQRKTRPMTWNQIAHKNLRFNQFIRNTINQYLGIFSDEKLESNFSSEETKLINPHQVKFSDGSEFLTEGQIPRILQFHRNPQEAKNNYQGHFILDQIIKSKQLDVNEIILADQQLRAINFLKDMTDTGIVNEIYEFQEQGTKIDSVVQKLNAVQAKFGQEYRKVQKDGKQFIVDVKKIDHIFPIDRMQNVSNFIADFEKNIHMDKLKLMGKHFQEMTKTGIIPKQLQQAFGQTKQTFDIDDIFSQIGISHGIWKKDIETIQKLQKYSKDQINKDIAMQLQVQKIRSKERPIDHNDMAKDPDNIDVKAQNGKFNVSKFKQI